jgi:hypothetical protein
MNRVSIIAIFGSIVLCGCERGRTYSSADRFTLRTNLVELTENSVRVAVALESDAQGLPVVRATFTPTEPGLHLYGKDMPEEGIDGFGVPTRLDILGGSLKPAGPVFADVSPHHLKVSDVKLPIYPEGPVTLRQPVEITGTQETSAELAFSYMACKTGGECKFPVQRKKVLVTIPKG